MENGDRKMQKVIAFLKDLDSQLDNLIINIEKEKDIVDARLGTDNVVDTNTINRFIDTINAIHIDGNEDVLIKINSKYNKAISLLSAEINRDDNATYKAQMEAELGKLMDNKSVRFDPISETYKELSARLDRGEVQHDYYKDKADQKEAEIKLKENQYKFKNGNIDIILATLQEPMDKLEGKMNIKKKYEELKKINSDIKKLEDKLKDPNLDAGERGLEEEELNSLKEKRKNLAQEFEQTATDKDGNKYKRANGKSDEEYINSIDKRAIEQAIADMARQVSEVLNNMPEDDRKITLLNRNMQEGEMVDVANMVGVNTPDGMKYLIGSLKEQKKLWNDKVKEQGYNKEKLQQDLENYQRQSRGVPSQPQPQPETTALGETRTSFWERFKHNRKENGVIKSFFKSFARKKTEEEMREEYVDNNRNYEKLDKAEAKKHALEYLEKNRKNLNRIDSRDDKESFKNSLRYNVNLTESEINQFWDEKQSQENDRESR